METFKVLLNSPRELMYPFQGLYSKEWHCHITCHSIRNVFFTYS